MKIKIKITKDGDYEEILEQECTGYSINKTVDDKGEETYHFYILK